MKHFKDKNWFLVTAVAAVMLVYFWVACPMMMDDGSQYEGFTESLAQGRLDFQSFYGFQGLSFLSVPVFWLTGSHDSIIITSAILSLLSVFLAYAIGRKYYQNVRGGLYFLALFLLMPYPYVTMMRGFQEAALLFFVLLIIYGSLAEKIWTPLSWAAGGIVKPFALILAPLWLKKDFFKGKKMIWLAAALALGGLYLGASYYQTGHLVNNAAIGSYQGNFDTGNPPPLWESFVPGWKGFARVGANLLLSFRKIMVSPLIILLGAWVLWRDRTLLLRRRIIGAVVLNLFLVGCLTFSFSKYLLPAAALLALSSVSLLLKCRWLLILIIVDSLFVFLPIYNYFGYHFWPTVYGYLTPLFLAGIVFWAPDFLKNKRRNR